MDRAAVRAHRACSARIIGRFVESVLTQHAAEDARRRKLEELVRLLDKGGAVMISEPVRRVLAELGRRRRT
jgi:hypothetical protein